MGALFAMSSASIAYRFGRIATLAMAPSTGSIAAFARGSSYLICLASEVTAFEGVQGLMNQTPTITQNRWIDSFINFGVLKGFGRLAAEQNWLIRNLSSDLGMVAGHEIAYQSGFGSAPEGSFIERMAHAQVVNLQLAAGSSLVHRALPRIQQLERSLDLLLNTSHHSIEPPSQTNLFGQPLLAHSNGNHHTREDRGLKTNIGLLAQSFEHSSNGPIYSGGMRSSHRLPAARHSTPPNYTLETLKRLQSFDSDNIGLVMDAIRIVNHLAEEVHPNTTQEFIYEEARELLLLQASLRSSGSLPSLDKSQRFYEDTVRVAYLLSRPQELSSMVESLQNIPSMSNLQIARLKGLAENIAGHLGKEGQSLRQAIHTQPSRDNISLVESYLRDAQSRDPHHTPLLSQLKESLQTLREIYEGRLSLSDISQNMSVLLRESIVFPESKHPDLEEVQSLAINIRKLWNEKRDRMSVEDSIQLARLAGSLQRFAFSQCDYIGWELHSGKNTRKIATLITTLYGSGYGTEAWLQIAREFSEMNDQKWDTWIEQIMAISNEETMHIATALQRGESPSVFRRFLMNGALAHEMILQVRDHYHDHFDPLL
ncbi:MAG: hypothetical protein JNK65_08710, partial [Deltaproteobacteria bacterium]|nr:hypothetical protein [Deltaproteobacteria bacterium]